jgi:2-isopropylmalate synthase
LTTSQLVLGKHSGRHAFRVHLEELGHRLGEDELNRAFDRFKALAERKKVLNDADLEAIVTDEFGQGEELYKLEGMQVSCGQPGMPTATLRLRDPWGVLHTQASIGTGPVDAVYRAVDAIVKVQTELLEFRVKAITEGIDALGEVTVRIREQSGRLRTFGGHGADPDILVASCQAYLAALNKLVSYNKIPQCRPAHAELASA